MRERTVTSNNLIVLEAIKKFISEKGFSPTVRDLCAVLGLKSPATVHWHLRKLKSKGLIDYNENKARTITVKKRKECDEVVS